MKTKDYLKNYTKEVEEYNVAFDLDCTIRISIDTKCYIMDNILECLAEHEITHLESTLKANKDCKYPVANIGFSEKENKWYGWSHRAIFGFTIGHECKKNNVGFVPSNKEEAEEEALSFWGDSEDGKENAHIENRTARTFDVVWTWSKNRPNEKIRGMEDRWTVEYPSKFGRGEWVAKTIEDAKQMAIDFANSIA